MAYHLFFVDATLDLISGVVALFVSYYAYRYNRLLHSTPLLFISFGFMLLGVGLLIESSVHLFSTVYAKQLAVFVEATAIYLIIQVLSYLIIALGYAYEAYLRAALSATFTPILLAGRRPQILLLPYRLSTTAELLSLVILVVVVYQATLVYTTTRNALARMVLSAFLLITLAQAVILGSVLTLSAFDFEIGELIRFLGFVFLLVFLVRSGRSEPR
ncbi:MAG: hypothetical protein QW688_03425 [Thermoprotei archaeon]